MSSAQIIPLQVKGKLYKFMENFLEHSKCVTVRKCVVDFQTCTRKTLLSPLEIAYYPYLNPELSCSAPHYTERHNVLARQLELLCVEAGVFSLHLSLLGDKEKEILKKEGLIDFVLCLRWQLPRGSRALNRANELLSYLSGEVELHPPSLLNMAKAKLASTQCGLRKITSCTECHY